MPRIISFSGNLGSGKDTVGQDAISYLTSKGYKAEKFFFSEALKRFCVDVLGLNESHVFGTQEDKNKVTHLKWEDMPGVVITLDENIKDFSIVKVGLDSIPTKLIAHRPGYMTVREVLQFVGTEIGRRMYDNVWIDATFRKIQKSDCDFVIFTDARFHNELDYLRKYGAVLVYLLRQPIRVGLEHSSETQLTTYKNWDELLDNRNLSIEEQREEVIKIIEKYFNV